MPIVAIEDGGATATPQYIMYIAPRKVKLGDSYYYPSNSNVRITSEGTIATKLARVDKQQGYKLHARVETLSNSNPKSNIHTIASIFIYLPLEHDERNWVARFILPKNLTKRQVQKIQDFLDKYFNN